MLRLVLLGLATWRLSSLLVHERGPFDVFGRIRHATGADRVGEMGEIQELFSCVWCMSIWVGLFLYVVRIPLLLYVLAASTIAILIDTWTKPRSLR